MLAANETNNLNQRLAKYLLSIPFPYGETLRAQVSASKLTNVSYPDLYSVEFEVDHTSDRLPFWLDTVPLSWKVLTDDAPILCQLFVKAGYIESFEIIDMGLTEIMWDALWNTPPTYDMQFDEFEVCDMLTRNEFVIQKMLIHNRNIDFQFGNDDNPQLACFRDCQIQKLYLEGFPKVCCLGIERIEQQEHKYLIHSQDGNIAINCTMLFLRKGVIG